MDQGQTEQGSADAAELERLKEVARRFGPLSDIADALEADPSRIFAIRAAMEGKAPQQQAPPQQQQRNLTKEEIDDLNRQALADPAGTMAAIARLSMEQARNDVFAQAAPLLSTTADLVIESFKTRKAAEDPLYRQIAPLFEAELRDVGRQTLIGMDPAARLRTLDLRWNSAAATVYRKAAAQVKPDVPVNHGGGAGGDGSGGAPKLAALQKNAQMLELANRLGLTEEEMAQINKELEDED